MITLHSPDSNDYNDWCDLYRGYADFYHQPMNDKILAQVWQWLADGKLHCILAKDKNGKAAGFAHWEFILRPLRGTPLSYLHDLYVYPDYRGSGTGGRLLDYVSTTAAGQGCQTVRWLTKADNTTARLLYDKKATAATEWVMYQQLIKTP